MHIYWTVIASSVVTKEKLSMLEGIDLILLCLKETHIYDKEIDMEIHMYSKNEWHTSNRIKKLYDNANCIW